MLHLCRRPSFPHRRPNCRRARSAHGAIGLLLALALCCGSAPARADWEITTEAGGQYDDNLTRAQDAVDKRAAGAAIIGVSGLSVTPWTGSDAIILALYGRAEIYDRYSGLSNVALGGNLAYRHKFGVGYAAPWVSVAVDGSYDNYRDNLRTGTRLDVRAETGRRLDQQADVAAGVYFERRYDNHGEVEVPGIPGDVFALAGVGAYARGGYAFTNGLYIGVAASVRRGDVESTAQQSLQIFLALRCDRRGSRLGRSEPVRLSPARHHTRWRLDGELCLLRQLVIECELSLRFDARRARSPLYEQCGAAHVRLPLLGSAPCPREDSPN